MFNGAQKYLPRGMVNTKQPSVYLGNRHRLNMKVPCAMSCMGTKFEGVYYLQPQKISANCNKCKESVSQENTNYVETLHINANKIKVMRNFCD